MYIKSKIEELKVVQTKIIKKIHKGVYPLAIFLPIHGKIFLR